MIQAITYLVPARYFITILKGIFLKGVGLRILWRRTRRSWSLYAVDRVRSGDAEAEAETDSA